MRNFNALLAIQAPVALAGAWEPNRVTDIAAHDSGRLTLQRRYSSDP